MNVRLALGLMASSFAAVIALAAAGAEAAYPAPAFPSGFEKWTRLKASSLDPTDPATARLSSAHFVYGNAAAVEGLKTGNYAAGAIFVLDIFKVEKKDGAFALGARESTSSMVRDARAGATGGWAFADYDVATRRLLSETKPVADCYECHTKKAGHVYVFTALPAP